MDILPIFLDGAALLIGLALIVGSFVSKTIVYGRMLGGKPQKITWFGRIFLFVAGLDCVYGFGLAILKQLHVAINPAWLDIGLPLSEVVLFVLALSLVVPVVIISARDSWLKRKEETRIQRIISICLTLIFLYLIWETTPAILRKVLTLFHDLSKGRVG
jgi:hypothetical protein